MGPDTSPVRIKLSDERRSVLITQLQELYLDQFDRELSDFHAEQVLAFFIKSLGPTVYNQAIQDARGFMQDRLDDLAGDLYEEEQ